VRTACDIRGRHIFDSNATNYPLRRDVDVPCLTRWGWYNDPSPWEALMGCGPEVGIKLLESADPEDLAIRVAVARDLLNSSTPLYSLEGLRILLRQFQSLHRLNKDHLIDTGFPRVPFFHSEWLYELLGYLYPTRGPILTEACWRDNKRRQAKGEVVLEYVWSAKQAAEEDDGNESEGVGYTPRFRDKDGVPYYKGAPLLQGLTAADDERIEKLRPLLLDLRLRVLDELTVALENKCSYGLWDACSKHINEFSRHEDIQYVADLDCSFLGVDFRTGANIPGSWDKPAGGLTDLIYLIGHVIEELSVGKFSRIHAALGDLVSPSPLKRIPQDGTSLLEWEAFGDVLSRPTRFENYYEFMDKPERKIMDQAIELSTRLESEYQNYWSGYRMNVRQVLGEESLAEMVRGLGVSRGNLKTVREFAKRLLALGASGAGLGVDIEKIRVDTDETFKFNGRFTSVILRGKPYDLTLTQGQVIEILWKAHLKGLPKLRHAEILGELDTTASRLRDVFKSNQNAWKALIKPEGKGIVRLNI